MPWKSCRWIVVLIAMPFLLLAGCSQAPAPAAPGAVAAASPASSQPEAPEQLPPDGVWLRDEQGREYFVREVPKPALFVWVIPDRQVRLPYGETYDVVGQDDQNFHVKIYRLAPAAAMAPPAGPSSEELAQAAATYVAETGAADRLQFRPFDAGLPHEGQWRNGFDIADMNGDGFLDIVHGPPRKGGRRPQVFLGDGKGNWRLWSEAKYPALAYDYGDALVADFNADGKPDVALAVHLRGLLLLVAGGPGEFLSWGKGLPFAAGAKSGTTFSSRAIAAADWNGDGRLDLVALGEGPRLAGNLEPGAAPPRPALGMTVYLNQGDGSWVESTGTAADKRAHGEDLAIIDLDGDSRVDAVLGSSVMGSREVFRRNLGDGSWAIESLPGLRESAIIEAVAVDDVDADGRADLLVGYRGRELKVWRTGIDLFFGQPGGGYERQTLWAEDGRAGLTALATGDIGGQGRRDVAALTGDGRTLVFLNDDRRRFSMEKTSEVPAEDGGCQGFDVALRDLDGDGRAELIAEFAGEPSALFAPNNCLHQGALRVWTVAPRSAHD